MSYPRVRIIGSVLAGVLAAGVAAASPQTAQATPPGRETSAASVASYALSQQMPVDPEVAVGTLPERSALLRARERQARPPGRAAPRRQGRFGARRRRPAGAGALRRAHGVRGHAALSAAEHPRFSLVARPEHRPGRERRDQLRRHPVHAARADRRRRACSIARCSSSRTGRRARRSIRAASTTSAASSCRNGGCTSARASGRRTRSAGSSSKGRATPIGRPSASPRSSSTRSASSWCGSTTTGTGRT